MAEEKYSDRAQSEFNMAVSYLNRLNQWFYLAGESRLRLDSYNWFHALTLLFSELSTEMKKDEIETKNKEILSLNTRVVKNQQSNMNSKRISIPPKLWLELHEFELFLRKVMKESGLQNKMKDDPRRAILQR